MSKQVIEDVTAAYNAWRDAPPGSYIERMLADAIVRDLVPALIHAAGRRPMPIGFTDVAELVTDTEIVDDDDTRGYD